MILLCHYFLFSDLNSGIGRYLGRTGNIIFFLVSALLYGLKYYPAAQPGNCVEHKEFDCKEFTIKRIIKFGASVWPFLGFLIILYVISGTNFSWFDACLNFLFLGYLGELPGNGHLWFLTVLLACYAEMVLFLKLKIKNKWFPWIVLLLSVAALIVGEQKGIPGGLFLTLGVFGLIFFKNSRFVEKTRSMLWWMSMAIIAINIVVIYLEYNGLFEQSRVFHFILTSLCGITLLALMLRFMPNKPNNVISFLSGISFEIYIVHHTLCAGPFVRITCWPCGHILNFIIMTTISVILAVALNYVAKFVASALNRFVTKYMA